MIQQLVTIDREHHKNVLSTSRKWKLACYELTITAEKIETLGFRCARLSMKMYLAPKYFRSERFKSMSAQTARISV